VVDRLGLATDIIAFDVKWFEDAMLVALHCSDYIVGRLVVMLVKETEKREVGQWEASPAAEQVIVGRAGDWAAFVGDELVQVIDLQTGCTVQKLPHEQPTGTFVASADEQLLVTTGYDGVFRVWERRSGREIARITSERALDVAFAQDRRTLVTAGGGQRAFAWDLAHPLDPVFDLRTGVGARAAFSAMGNVVVSSGTPFRPGELLQAPKTSLVLAAETGTWKLLGGAYCSGMVQALDVSPDGRYAAVASSGKALAFEASSQAEPFLLPQEEVTAVAFAGPTLISLAYDGMARLWDCESRREVASCSHQAESHALTCAPSSELFALGGDGTGVSVWRAPAAMEVRRLPPRGPAPPRDGILRLPSLQLRLSRDGRLLAIHDVDRMVWVWDVETETAAGQREVEGWLSGMSFNADGTRLALASSLPTKQGDREVGLVQIFDTGSGNLVFERRFDQAAVSVAFHPNEASIVSGHADGWVRIWDPTTGRDLVETRHRRRVNTVAFSPDGRWLLSAAQDGIARVTMFRTEDLLREADLRLPRLLTKAELREFIPELS
jgi:WD40 repeat protein